MKKLLVVLISFLLISVPAESKSPKGMINSTLDESGIPRSSIAISIKNVDTGKPVYEMNENMLMHPASVQKILTLPAIMDVLGEDYKFKTTIYSRGTDGYVIKLGADPYFSTSDLKNLVKHINSDKVKTVYLDDSIVENKDWGEGWQWDDDLNTCMPRFNAYNLDKNLIKITVIPTKDGAKASIINPSKYPLVFFNNVITSKETSVNVTRDSSVASNALTLNGTVSKPVILTIPANNLRGYFHSKLAQLLSERNIYLKNAFAPSKVAQSDVEISSVTHEISQAEKDVLVNSDNMVIEILAKIAGEKAYGKTGTDVSGIRVFNDYCNKIGLDKTGMRLVDASGVSKNNLVSANFVTEYLVANKDNKVYSKMATPGVGTLESRMIPLKENLRAKTGTLSDISSIAGFLTSKSGKHYVFCIIINNPNSTSSDKKALEDYLIRDLYLKG